MEDKVIDTIMEAMKKAFEERQNEPFQYVVAYRRIKDDSLFGYHLDTFCNVTQEKETAKRYSGDNPYGQLAIIRKNLDYTLDMTEEKAEKGFFSRLNMTVKNGHFEGVSKEDLYIEAEYLDDDIPPQRFEYQIIKKDELEQDDK